MEYKDYIQYFLRNMYREPDSLEIGENISHIEELKIIFDGYGYDEETNQDGAEINSESYAIFIHKDALDHDFVFPDHESGAWNLIHHRPSEEVCIWAWYDVQRDHWEVINILDSHNDSQLTYEQGLSVIKGLYERYADGDQ